MNHDLFRQESLDANKTKVLGPVALYCPPFRWLIVAMVCALTIVLVGFCSLGSYTKRETAKGVLTPESGIMTITALTAGTVTALPVREGAGVKKGERIATVSSEISTARYGQTREAIARQLEIQSQGLTQQLTNLEQRNAEALKSLQERSSLLAQQTTELDTIYRQRQRQIALSQKQVDKMAAMRAEGYASNTQVEQQESDLLDAKVRLQDVARQRIEIRQQHAQTRQQLREQPLTYFQQKNDLQQKLSDITQSMMENESRRSVDLRAPEEGTVSAVLVKPGKLSPCFFRTTPIYRQGSCSAAGPSVLSTPVSGWCCAMNPFPGKNLASTLARSAKSRHPPCHLRKSPVSPAIPRFRNRFIRSRSRSIASRYKLTANR